MFIFKTHTKNIPEWNQAILLSVEQAIINKKVLVLCSFLMQNLPKLAKPQNDTTYKNDGADDKNQKD